MTSKRVLVDTGPLVAILLQTDAHHDICVEVARNLASPLSTSWPVITEAAWLLRKAPDGIARLFDQLNHGLLVPLELDQAAIPWIRVFLEKYRDLGPQLADASLCYLSVREGIEDIFTLDRRDFAVFRTPQNQPFRLLPE